MSDAPTRPSWASRRVHWSKVGFAALDFETTGLDANDTVISFGVVPVVGGRIALANSVYRTVSMASELSAQSIVVHGLLPVDLADSPPMQEVRPILRDALDGRFLLTWAAEVEAAFLAQLFGGAPSTVAAAIRRRARACDPRRPPRGEGTGTGRLRADISRREIRCSGRATTSRVR